MAVLEFRSPAAGGFIMMSDTFKAVCEVLGRPYSDEGCLLPEDIPAAIEKIQAAVDREKVLLAEMERLQREKELRGGPGFESFEEIEEQKKAKERVSFCMRVYPLLEMMKQAQKKDKKLWWGVP